MEKNMNEIGRDEKILLEIEHSTGKTGKKRGQATLNK
jgi:hypothetical protein